MRSSPIVILHRAGHPENTLEAIKASLVSGAEGIEIDLRACKDEIVVFHDESLERVTGGKFTAKIKDVNYSRLKEIRIFNRTFVPKLQDAFMLLENRNAPFYVKLDIKSYDEMMKDNLYSMVKDTMLRNNDIIFMVDLDEEIEESKRSDLFRYWKNKRSKKLLLELPGKLTWEDLRNCDVVGYTYNKTNVYSEIPSDVRSKKMTDIYIEEVDENTLEKILTNLKKYHPTFITPNYRLNLKRVNYKIQEFLKLSF